MTHISGTDMAVTADMVRRQVQEAMDTLRLEMAAKMPDMHRASNNGKHE